MRRTSSLLSYTALAALLAAPTLGGCGGSSVTGLGDDDAATLPDGGDDASDGSQDGPNNDNPVCGNGFVEGTEQCDDGMNNGTPGDPCDNGCTWHCLNKPGNTQCDDMNPCNGVETCTDQHTCQPGTPIAEGGTCATGKICRSGTCVDSTCGDGIVTAPEECDDGNTVSGDGCEPVTCKFTCVAGDPNRACPVTDVCAGTPTCTTTHTCAAGTPLADGTACGSGTICKSGKCSAATCGDGFVTAPEQCDFGAGNGPGTGCEANCTYSCASDAACSDGNVCNGTETCGTVTVSGATGKKCQPGTNAPAGTACTGGQCDGAGACKPIGTKCGNGTLDAGEQCDLGTAVNGTGQGCSATCQFDCTTAPDSCAAADTNACDGTMKCTVVTGLAGTGTGQKCVNGTAPAACTACTGGICVSSLCAAPKCGDGCVTTGEQCDPPNGTTCSATCQTITPTVCGNGKREAGEQCDDGNTTNLDGCDSSCQFEQDHRIDSLTMVYDTSICTYNALGKAVTNSLAQGQLQTSLTNGVKDGSISILFEFLYPSLPHDLTGTNVNPIVLGNMTGTPAAAPTGLTYNGASDLDWWYTASTSGLDANRIPTAKLTGSIATKNLSVPSGNFTIMVNLGSGAQPLSLSAVNLKAQIGATSAPTMSTSGNTPGHLASENLDPTLTSFATMQNGTLCSNVSAYSLSKAPIPASLATGGSNACNENYPTTATLLDLFNGGCTVTVFFIKTVVIQPTQPDQSDPTAPVWGAGPTYSLTRTGTSVTGCKDKNGLATTNSTDFTTCLKSAAYSSSFKFGSDRVIVK